MSSVKKVQSCPTCKGTGKVSRPPYVAGDVKSWVSNSTGTYPCQTCKGQCVVPVGEMK